MDGKFPEDKTIKKGVLKNGITYYLRHNNEPKDRASFYIIRNAGALLEEDHQDGLAHFLEHMAFNGTTNFPKKGIISTLEKYGLAFGRNINAYTAHNETVYNIDDVPTNIPKLLDTCLLILHDWTYYLALEGEEIDAERKVITEEWRQRNTAETRIRNQILPVITKGSKYAIRDVIGKMDIVNNCEYQALRDFYHKWYRTDLEAIAIVGDFDVDEMEKKVIELFSSVPAVENPAERPFYEIPYHKEHNYVLATDKEATSSDISIATLFKDNVKPEDMNYGYYREALIRSMYNSMIGQRIGELMQKPNPPFIQASIGFTGFLRGYDMYNISATPRPNEEAIALKAILEENQKVIRYGFLDSELERVKINVLAGLESNYKKKDKTHNNQFIQSMQSNFLEGSPMVSFEDYYKFAKAVIPTITAEEVSAKAKEWNIKENMTIMITGPDNLKHLSEKEVLDIMKSVEGADIESHKDNITTDSELIKEDLVGSKIVKTKKLEKFDATEWTLENGAVVVFRKAEYDKESVALVATSDGGSSVYKADLIPSVSNTSALVSNFGIADYDAVTLGKMLTGKIANVGTSIGGLTEQVSGGSSPKDFETMLQLVYLTFEKPRFDEVMYNNIISQARASLVNMDKNPMKAMQDSLSMIMANYSERVKLFNEDYINSINLKDIEKIYKDRFKNAAEFKFFIVGNIDEETVKPLVEKYIGSIKKYDRKDKWVDNKVRGPKGKTEKVIKVKMADPKATVIINMERYMKNSPYNGLVANVLKGILEIRYTESVREEAGGTYGVGVSTSSSRIPVSTYGLSINFECQEDRVNDLKPLIYKELFKIIVEGPKEEDMRKVILNMKKNNEQSKKHNAYWMGVLRSYYSTKLDITDTKNFDEILDNLTTKDVQKWAKKFYKRANIVDVVFEPKK